MPDSREGRFAPLLVALVGFVFVLYPGLEPEGWQQVALDLGFTAVVVTALWMVPGHRRLQSIALVLTALTLAAQWAHHLFPTREIQVLGHALGLVFVAFITGLALRQVLARGAVTGNRIQGAVAVYLLIGLLWTFAYALMTEVEPGGLLVSDSSQLAVAGEALPGEPSHGVGKDFGTLVYFSFVTLSTLGYGDILPVGPFTQSLALLEALLGQIYLAVLVARLVGLQVAAGSAATGDAAQDASE